MLYFRVSNWRKFQHFRDRNPPWIKVYNSLLESPDFLTLPENTKWHLVAIWLLASRFKNKLPFDPDFIAGRISATSQVNLQLLMGAGFIEQWDEGGTKALSSRQHDDTPEREAESESERTVRRPHRKMEPQPGFVRFWLNWPAHRRKVAKRHCAAYWRRHRLEEETEAILAHLATMKNSRDWIKDGGEYIPMPQTYLHQRRWDVQAVPRRAASRQATDGTDDAAPVSQPPSRQEPGMEPLGTFLRRHMADRRHP